MSQNTTHISSLLYSAGLRLREQDTEALTLWIAHRVRKLALPGIGAYHRLLSEDSAAGGSERELLTVQFSTGETYFFRDHGQIDLIATKLLPELIERRAGQRTLRLWSAGCSTGEEAYTLAMMIDELAPALAGWQVDILGTDINRASLEKARSGLYREWSFRALDAERKQRYFRQCGDQWQIDQRLRDRANFRSLDLVQDRFPDAESGIGGFDLILCRNVFIYLDPSAVTKIAAKFAATLADGGYLVTGHSELFGHDTAPLRMRMFAQSAAFQKNGRSEDADKPDPAPVQSPAAPVILFRPTVVLPAGRIEQPSVHSRPPVTMPETCDQIMQAARHHADRGQPSEAERDCRKAIALAAFDPRPYYLLAQLAQERGDTAQAKTLLKKVIYLDPAFVAAYLELGALQAQAGEYERARRMYETACFVLAKLPANAAVAPYAESTAADILSSVQRLLDSMAEEHLGATRLPQPQSA